MFIILEHWHRLLHMRALSCVKEEERIRNSSSIRWTFQVPSTSSRKDDLTGHRYGKKPGDREYFSANQLKKKCKKKFFQGIHDRFIRDETFRNRMIENGRDEDACRQMDVLADEDHTHHFDPTRILPLQEYLVASFKQDRFQY